LNAAIGANYSVLDFGLAPLGYTAGAAGELTVRVTNTGASALSGLNTVLSQPLTGTPPFAITEGAQTDGGLAATNDYVDIKVAAADSLVAGTYSETLTVKSNEADNIIIALEFEVRAGAITIGAVSAAEYAKVKVEPEPAVKFTDVTLEKGVDYTFSYGENTSAGAGSVQATGMGRFKDFSSEVKYFDITPKPLSINESVTVSSKTYDGNATASLSGTYTLAGGGVMPGDIVEFDASRVAVAFADKDAGEGKELSFDWGEALAGADSHNYSLTPPDTSAVRAGIAKRAVTVRAPSKTVAQNDALPTLTAADVAYTGFVGGDSAASAISTLALPRYAAADASALGASDIDFAPPGREAALNGTVGANYELAHEKGTLTVIAGAPPVTGTPVPYDKVPAAKAPTAPGQVVQLPVSLTFPDGTSSDVTWASSSPSVAAVDGATGRLTGLREGAAVLTATSVSDASLRHQISVVIAKGVTKVRTPLTTLYVKKGKSLAPPVCADSVNLSTKKADTAAKLTWKSSNAKVASVNAATGKISAKKKGKATITATSLNGKRLALKVNVVTKSVKLSKMKVTKAPASMKKGKAAQLKVKATPAKATGLKVTFKSSKKSVVSVDKAGKLTALKKGKAKITVKIGKKSYSKTIKVK
jgi:uncharacterized protein YjdB